MANDTASFKYDGSVVINTVDNMVAIGEKFTPLATDIKKDTNTIVSARGFQEYINAINSDTYSTAIEQCGAMVGELANKIRQVQVEILSYSENQEDIDAFLDSLSRKDYDALDLSKIDDHIQWWRKVGNFFAGIGSSIATFGISLGEGILDFLETGADLITLAGTGIASIGTGLYDLVTGSHVTEDMWKETKAWVSDKKVENAFNSFYANTEFGRTLRDNAYGFESVRGIGKGIGYSAGVIAVTVLTGGAAAGGLAAVGTAGTVSAGQLALTAGVLGFANGVEESWADGATLGKGLLYGAAAGGWEAAQWAIGAKINAFGGFGDTVAQTVLGKAAQGGFSRAALDAADSAAEGFVQPALSMIYKDYGQGDFISNYQTAFEQAGGWENVRDQAIIGGVMSAATESNDIRKILKTGDGAKVDVGAGVKADTGSGTVDIGYASSAAKGADVDVNVKTKADAAFDVSIDGIERGSKATATASNQTKVSASSNGSGGGSVDVGTSASKSSSITPKKLDTDGIKTTTGGGFKPSADVPSVDTSGKVSVGGSTGDTGLRSIKGFGETAGGLTTGGSASVLTDAKRVADVPSAKGASKALTSSDMGSVAAGKAASVDAGTGLASAKAVASASGAVTPSLSGVDTPTTYKTSGTAGTGSSVSTYSGGSSLSVPSASSTSLIPSASSTSLIPSGGSTSLIPSGGTSVTRSADINVGSSALGTSSVFPGVSLKSMDSSVSLSGTSSTSLIPSGGSTSLIPSGGSSVTRSADVDFSPSAKSLTSGLDSGSIKPISDGGVRTSFDSSSATQVAVGATGTTAGIVGTADSLFGYRYSGVDATPTSGVDISTGRTHFASTSLGTSSVGLVPDTGKVSYSGSSDISTTKSTFSASDVSADLKKTGLSTGDSAVKKLDASDGQSTSSTRSTKQISSDMERISETLQTRKEAVDTATSKLDEYRKNNGIDTSDTSRVISAEEKSLIKDVDKATKAYDTQMDKLRGKQDEYRLATENDPGVVGSEKKLKIINDDNGGFITSRPELTDASAKVEGQVDGSALKTLPKESSGPAKTSSSSGTTKTDVDSTRSKNQVRSEMDRVAETLQRRKEAVDTATSSLDDYRKSNGIDPGDTSRVISADEQKLIDNVDKTTKAYDTQMDKLRSKQEEYRLAAENDPGMVGSEKKLKIINDENGGFITSRPELTDASAKVEGQIDGSALRRLPADADAGTKVDTDVVTKPNTNDRLALPGEERLALPGELEDGTPVGKTSADAGAKPDVERLALPGEERLALPGELEDGTPVGKVADAGGKSDAERLALPGEERLALPGELEDGTPVGKVADAGTKPDAERLALPGEERLALPGELEDGTPVGRPEADAGGKPEVEKVTLAGDEKTVVSGELADGTSVGRPEADAGGKPEVEKVALAGDEKTVVPGKLAEETPAGRPEADAGTVKPETEKLVLPGEEKAVVPGKLEDGTPEGKTKIEDSNSGVEFTKEDTMDSVAAKLDEAVESGRMTREEADAAFVKAGEDLVLEDKERLVELKKQTEQLELDRKAIIDEREMLLSEDGADPKSVRGHSEAVRQLNEEIYKNKEEITNLQRKIDNAPSEAKIREIEERRMKLAALEPEDAKLMDQLESENKRKLDDLNKDYSDRKTQLSEEYHERLAEIDADARRRAAELEMDPHRDSRIAEIEQSSSLAKKQALDDLTKKRLDLENWADKQRERYKAEMYDQYLSSSEYAAEAGKAPIMRTERALTAPDVTAKEVSVAREAVEREIMGIPDGGKYGHSTRTISELRDALTQLEAREQEVLRAAEASKPYVDPAAIAKADAAGIPHYKLGENMEPLSHETIVSRVKDAGIHDAATMELYKEDFTHSASKYGVTTHEMKAVLDEKVIRAVSEGEFGRRTGVQTLEKCLDSGFIKSQFETGASGGYIDEFHPDNKHWVRAELEEEMFGIDQTTPYVDRPIYGMVFPYGDAEMKEYIRRGPGTDYGAGSWITDKCVIIFNKDAIADCTTFTCGDSLDYCSKNWDVGRSVAPSTVVDPKFTGAYEGFFDRYDTIDDLKNAPFSDMFGGAGLDDDYLELQIHGQAAHAMTSQNIKEVIFLAEPSAQLQEKLKLKGIPWRVL